MFEVEVIFWGKNKGGRINPPLSGFSPQVSVNGIKTSCTLKLLHEEVFQFDVKYLAQLYLTFFDVYGEKFAKQTKIEFYEGNKKIGEGIIL